MNVFRIPGLTLSRGRNTLWLAFRRVLTAGKGSGHPLAMKIRTWKQYIEAVEAVNEFRKENGLRLVMSDEGVATLKATVAAAEKTWKAAQKKTK